MTVDGQQHSEGVSVTAALRDQLSSGRLLAYAQSVTLLRDSDS